MPLNTDIFLVCRSVWWAARVNLWKITRRALICCKIEEKFMHLFGFLTSVRWDPDECAPPAAPLKLTNEHIICFCSIRTKKRRGKTSVMGRTISLEFSRHPDVGSYCSRPQHKTQCQKDSGRYVGVIDLWLVRGNQILLPHGNVRLKMEMESNELTILSNIRLYSSNYQ